MGLLWRPGQGEALEGEGEQLVSYVTYCINLIYTINIAMNFHQDIPQGYFVMFILKGCNSKKY